MLGLERTQLADEQVVLGVGQLGCIELVVEMVGTTHELAERRRALERLVG
jgi:hypothetical protein